MNKKFLWCLITLLVFYGFSSAQLAIEVQSLEPANPGLYEKIELKLQLKNATFSNPFNPNEIDIQAFFTSPTDSIWPVFGFYDNYRTANAWKVRFAANETGPWRCVVRVINHGDTAWSAQYNFTVDSSAYHGWIRVSKRNAHYFEYDDGKPFYGVGAYYPWGVNNGPDGLELLQNSGANIFGYWNIMYGDEEGIIESLNSGLGRYDQTKCGRIDQVLQWAEQRNLKIMLAIWPHDLLSNTVWSHQWHNNPYKYVCSAEEFYGSEQAWQYQQWQYRYLIARWGYSRALAIWEIVNEINGTDGWQKGHQTEATEWVGKVRAFFAQNDPHGRPCTASQSGGIYWSEGYRIVDVPNVHLYETNWPAPFPGNPLRSSAQLYYDIARQLRQDFRKPAFLGEAGYLETFGGFEVPSPEYTQLYHNALWAGWTGGYATTPFWWAFNSRKIMSLDVMKQMKAFSRVARLIDYPNHQFEPMNQIQNNVDLYVMKSAELIFGWARESNSRPVTGKVLTLDGLSLKDTVYSVSSFNTWSGEKILTQYVPSKDGRLIFSLPDDGQKNPDQAFIIRPVTYGSRAQKVALFSPVKQLFSGDTSAVPVYCYIKDEHGLIVPLELSVQFVLQGVGQLVGENPVTSSNGMAEIYFRSDGRAGQAQLFVRANGLVSDTLVFRLSNEIWLDTFEDYAGNIALNSSWQVRGGTSVVLSLTGADALQGAQALQADYSIGDGSAYYAGFFKGIEPQFSGAELLSFWLKDDNSQRDLILMVKDTSGSAYQFTLKLAHPEWQLIKIPFEQFGAPHLHSGNVREIAFNILAGQATSGSGWLRLDAISLQHRSTGLENRPSGRVNDFIFYTPFPNPFNQQTRVKFFLNRGGPVRLDLINLLGQSCSVLLDGCLQPGMHRLVLNARNLASGIYFLRLKSDQHETVRKIILIK